MSKIPFSSCDTLRNCPVCGVGDLIALQLAVERIIFVTDGDEMRVRLGVSSCGQCGFIFLNPRMSPATLADYYHRQSRLPRAEIPEASPLMRLMDSQIDLIEAHHPLERGAAVLEVGCAEGFFLERLYHRKNGGARVFGVEPSRRYVETARARLPHAWFYENMLENVDFNGGRFDLVVMRHVFEHVLNPMTTLGVVSGVLRPGGVVYVEVPDAATTTPSVAHFFNYEHLSYFTRETLIATLARAGLRPIYIDRFQGNPPNSGFDYPVLRAVAVPDASAQPTNVPEQARIVWEMHNSATRRFLASHLAPVEARVKALQVRDGRLALFGAGPHTMDLLETLDIPISVWSVILDNNPAKQGKRLRGILVEGPTPKRLAHLDAVLVSSAAFEGEIVEQLKIMAPPNLEILTIYS